MLESFRGTRHQVRFVVRTPPNKVRGALVPQANNLLLDGQTLPLNTSRPQRPMMPSDGREPFDVLQVVWEHCCFNEDGSTDTIQAVKAAIGSIFQMLGHTPSCMKIAQASAAN